MTTRLPHTEISGPQDACAQCGGRMGAHGLCPACVFAAMLAEKDAPAPDLPTPQTVAGYELMEPLGQGGP
jgi:hypothetical protein